MFAQLKAAIKPKSSQDIWAYAADAATQDSTAFFNMLHGQNRYGPSSLNQKGDGREFYQLRTYQAGDPLSRIDWKSSARRDTIMLRERDYDFDKHIYFGLLQDDTLDYRAEPNRPSRREAITKFALSIALAALHKGYQIGCAGQGLFGRTETAAEMVLETLNNTSPTTHKNQNCILFTSGLSNLIPFLENNAAQNIIVVQCLDDTELDLPFEGQGLVSADREDTPYRIDDFAAIRFAYQNKLHTHIHTLKKQIEDRGYHFSCLRSSVDSTQLFKALTKPITELP